MHVHSKISPSACLHSHVSMHRMPVIQLLQAHFFHLVHFYSALLHREVYMIFLSIYPQNSPVRQVKQKNNDWPTTIQYTSWQSKDLNSGLSICSLTLLYRHIHSLLFVFIELFIACSSEQDPVTCYLLCNMPCINNNNTH